MPRIALLMTILLCSQGARAAGDIPYHHLALFVGGGVEEKKDHDKNTWAVGLEYEYRFSDLWGVGAVFEKLGEDAIRNRALIVPFSFHPGRGWRLFTGPGYEWNSKKDKMLLRMGVGYEFKLGGHWSIAPEALVDLIENGDNTWLAGVAIGYHF